MKNAIFIIKPYKWEGMWVFDDPSVGLVKEPFVGGMENDHERTRPCHLRVRLRRASTLGHRQAAAGIYRSGRSNHRVDPGYRLWHGRECPVLRWAGPKRRCSLTGAVMVSSSAASATVTTSMVAEGPVGSITVSTGFLPDRADDQVARTYSRGRSVVRPVFPRSAEVPGKGAIGIVGFANFD